MTGSVDNLTVAEQAAQFGIRLTLRGFLTASAPITLASLAILIARIDD